MSLILKCASDIKLTSNDHVMLKYNLACAEMLLEKKYVAILTS